VVVHIYTHAYTCGEPIHTLEIVTVSEDDYTLIKEKFMVVDTSKL